MGNSGAVAVLLISFFVMILLRFPIAYSVALASILCLVKTTRNVDASAVAEAE